MSGSIPSQMPNAYTHKRVVAAANQFLSQIASHSAFNYVTPEIKEAVIAWLDKLSKTSSESEFRSLLSPEGGYQPESFKNIPNLGAYISGFERHVDRVYPPVPSAPPAPLPEPSALPPEPSAPLAPPEDLKAASSAGAGVPSSLAGAGQGVGSRGSMSARAVIDDYFSKVVNSGGGKDGLDGYQQLHTEVNQLLANYEVASGGTEGRSYRKLARANDNLRIILQSSLSSACKDAADVIGALLERELNQSEFHSSSRFSLSSKKGQVRIMRAAINAMTQTVVGQTISPTETTAYLALLNPVGSVPPAPSAPPMDESTAAKAGVAAGAGEGMSLSAKLETSLPPAAVASAPERKTLKSLSEKIKNNADALMQVGAALLREIDADPLDNAAIKKWLTSVSKGVHNAPLPAEADLSSRFFADGLKNLRESVQSYNTAFTRLNEVQDALASSKQLRSRARKKLREARKLMEKFIPKNPDGSFDDLEPISVTQALVINVYNSINHILNVNNKSTLDISVHQVDLAVQVQTIEAAISDLTQRQNRGASEVKYLNGARTSGLIRGGAAERVDELIAQMMALDKQKKDLSNALSLMNRVIKINTKHYKLASKRNKLAVYQSNPAALFESNDEARREPEVVAPLPSAPPMPESSATESKDPVPEGVPVADPVMPQEDIVDWAARQSITSEPEVPTAPATTPTVAEALATALPEPQRPIVGAQIDFLGERAVKDQRGLTTASPSSVTAGGRSPELEGDHEPMGAPSTLVSTPKLPPTAAIPVASAQARVPSLSAEELLANLPGVPTAPLSQQPATSSSTPLADGELRLPSAPTHVPESDQSNEGGAVPAG